MDDQNRTNRISWFIKLRRLTIRKRRYSIENANNEIQFRRHLVSSEENIRSGTRNSFRRSFKKMGSRLKNSIFKNVNTNNNNRQTIDIPSSSSPLVVNRNAKVVENLYVLEPKHKENNWNTDPPPVPQRNTIAAIPSGAPASPVRNSRENINQKPVVRKPTDEIRYLSNCGWYWGPLSTVEAEEKLLNTPEGSFIIRDSSSTNYLFSISFRTLGKTLHSRITYTRGCYGLYDQEGFPTINELIDNAMEESKKGVYCYTSSLDNTAPNFPVRLTTPVSRYTHVPTLKHLCRFVIRQCMNINDLSRLPLPKEVNTYLRQGSYF